MGLFEKLFGKKKSTDFSQNLTTNDHLEKGETFISNGDNYGFKIVTQLTDEQRQALENSSILLKTGQLYMHYWINNLVCTDPNNPEWQNKVVFFWKADEPFPKKSLPKEFETFENKFFLFKGDTSKVSLYTGQAMPWFGMPGLGEKHYCEINGQKITIPELNALGLVDYFIPVELTNDNLNILTDKENYYLLIDDKITFFQNGSFYLNDSPISIDLAYNVGGIHIIKTTELEK